MKWFFEIATHGLGEFLACATITGIPFYFIYKSFQSYFRSKTIRDKGWPPDYCDADGQQLTEEQEG